MATFWHMSRRNRGLAALSGFVFALFLSGVAPATEPEVDPAMGRLVAKVTDLVVPAGAVNLPVVRVLDEPGKGLLGLNEPAVAGVGVIG